MNIKKVDDKPMLIHTKEKTKLHIKQEPEAKIKGRNVLVVDKSPKIAGVDKADTGKVSAKEAVQKSMQKENSVYAQMQRTKQDREKAVSKKSSTAKTVTSAGAMTALDQMDGGNEVYESYQVARTLSAPAISAANASVAVRSSVLRRENLILCSGNIVCIVETVMRTALSRRFRNEAANESNRKKIVFNQRIALRETQICG